MSTRTSPASFSRPVLAGKFFLQPLERGWARYRGRLRPGPAPPRSLESLESLSRQESDHGLGQSQYWSRDGMDRLEFLTRIIERLEKRGWQFRVDTGWGDFDIEIFGSRWVSLQLATAAEPHPGRRQRLRCRLRCVWPLASWTAFFAALGLELAGIGLLRGEHGWPWLLLCTMLAFPWLLRREERGQLRMIAALLDQAAADSGLARLAPPKEPPPGETAK